VNQTHQE